MPGAVKGDEPGRSRTRVLSVFFSLCWHCIWMELGFGMFGAYMASLAIQNWYGHAGVDGHVGDQ